MRTRTGGSLRKVIGFLAIGAVGCYVGPSDSCPQGFVCTPGSSSTGTAGGTTGSMGGTIGGSSASSATTGAGNTTIGAGSTNGRTTSGTSTGGTTVGSTSSSSSGSGSSGAVQPTSSSIAVLPYRVVDAKFSTALSKLVMVSDTPSNALHIFNPADASDVSVPLPLAPVAVALDVTGQKAAVAYDANVSWIDLASATLTKNCSVSSDAYDVALGSNGVAYVMPATDQWVDLHAIDLSNCAESESSGLIYAHGHIAMHPSELAVFDADQGLSPSRVERCSLSPYSCTDSEGQADWGTYSYCGALWISADGQRIYTGCGVTLRVPGNVTGSPCSYGGTLSGVRLLAYLSEAPAAQRVVMIPGVSQYGYPSSDPDADTVVRVHETQYLNYVTSYALPSFPLSGSGVAKAHGRFVFAAPDMGHIYVVVQADASSGALNDFAVATLVP